MVDAGTKATVATAPTTAVGSRGMPEEGFDRVVERLRSVVEKLEGGSLSLEESLAVFEEGVLLSRRGVEVLDRAERRVELLSRSATGEGEVVPFEPEREG